MSLKDVFFFLLLSLVFIKVFQAKSWQIIKCKCFFRWGDFWFVHTFMCLKTWFYLLHYTISVTTLLLISCSKRWEAVYDQLNEVEIISLICAGTKIPSLSFRGFPSLKWQCVRLQSTSSCGADWSPHTSCSAGADSSAGKICTHTWLCPSMLCYVVFFALESSLHLNRGQWCRPPPRLPKLSQAHSSASPVYSLSTSPRR